MRSFFKGLAGAVLGVLVFAAGAALSQSLPGTITGTESTWQRSLFWVGMLRVSRDETITAKAGGGQATAYQLIWGINRVTTVASGNDSVKLPVCDGGKMVTVINAAAANSLNVFGQTGETINALSANTAFAVAANKVVIFVCGNTGAWYSNLTA